MFKKFFNSPFIIVCFCIYIIITAFIFSSALTGSEKSGLQSNTTANVISDVVEFFTNKKVVLKNDGNTGKYPTSLEIITPNETLMVGKTFKLNYKTFPNDNYTGLDVEFKSSDPSIIYIDKSGEATIKNTGECKLEITEKNSRVKASKTFNIGSEVFTPKIEIVNVSTESDGKLYYSSSNGAGSIYRLDYYCDQDIDTVKITSNDETAFSFVQGKNCAYFLTKKVGSFNISVEIEYDNINSLLTNEKQVVTKSIAVEVVNKTLTLPQSSFTFEKDTLIINKGETTNINITALFGSGLTTSQKQLFYTINKNVAEITESKTTHITLKGNKVGATKLIVFYLNGNEIIPVELKIEVVKGYPTVATLSSTYNYVDKDSAINVTPVLDGDAMSADTFIWEVSNPKIATIDKNGKLIGIRFGKITVKATSTVYDGLVIENTYYVRRPYNYTVRKLVGHFFLFAALALFASVVYYRLAKVVSPKKEKWLKILLTLLCGLLTAGISELFQLNIFVQGRSATPLDILIDFSGYLLGYLIFLLIGVIFNKIKNKKTKIE